MCYAPKWSKLSFLVWHIFTNLHSQPVRHCNRIETKFFFGTKRAPFPCYFLYSRKPQDVALGAKKHKKKNKKIQRNKLPSIFEGLKFFSLECVRLFNTRRVFLVEWKNKTVFLIRIRSYHCPKYQLYTLLRTIERHMKRHTVKPCAELMDRRGVGTADGPWQ